MFWTSSDYPIISRTQFSSAQQKTSPCVVFASIFRRRQSSLCIQIHKTLLKPDTRKKNSCAIRNSSLSKMSWSNTVGMIKLKALRAIR